MQINLIGLSTALCQKYGCLNLCIKTEPVTAGAVARYFYFSGFCSEPAVTGLAFYTEMLTIFGYNFTNLLFLPLLKVC